ncbi:MAG: glucoamylase family protein, partial [Bryobacteraceae bacterium]
MKRSSVLNRRDFLRLGAAALTVPAVGKAFEPNELPLNRQGLLEEIERRACRYFYDQAHPETGLVRDRVRVAGFDGRRVASIAATGFGLSALCIGSSRGYIPTRDAIDRAETTLSFLARRAPHRGGFFYHFADMETGQRALNSEISSVDTAW